MAGMKSLKKQRRVQVLAAASLALVVAFWANRRPCRDSHDEAEVDVQEVGTRPA